MKWEVRAFGWRARTFQGLMSERAVNPADWSFRAPPYAT